MTNTEELREVIRQGAIKYLLSYVPSPSEKQINEVIQEWTDAARQKRMNELKMECGEGWRKLVEACHQELLEIDPGYKPTQIKEKFGHLRYYFDTTLKFEDPNFHHMHRIANRYELKSMWTCEVCGEKGETIARNGWHKTLCEQHKERTH
jgi:rubrerythrin